MELDRSLGVFFRSGVRVTSRRPSQSWRFLRTARHQAAAARVRRGWLAQGLSVPPIAIFSITRECNLACAGCYARSLQSRDFPDNELSSERLSSIVAEAESLGISFFVIAGGEPLMRPEILDIAERHPRVLFLLLTNGLLLDGPIVERLARLRNVVPLLSLEGTAFETDHRRGEGTHAAVAEAMRRLRNKHAFFGCSLTLTRENFSTVLDEGYVAASVEAGCGFFLFLAYTPVQAATEDWVLSEEQNAQVGARVAALRRRHRALFVAVPWDEEDAGGCLSAGRGFIHINASGDVEPCPFAPYSDVNLNDESLARALRSPFLRALRELPGLADETGTGCTLWRKREQVERVLAEQRLPAPPTEG